MPRVAHPRSVSAPMTSPLNGSSRPSCVRESAIVTSPNANPAREPSTRCGAFVIDSWPPATTTSASPVRTSRAASITAVRPDRHSLLIVTVGTSQPMPARIDAWRAGPCLPPAWTTWPTITASTWSGRTPAAASAPRIACAPRSAADSAASAPRNRVNGVRAPCRRTGVVSSSGVTSTAVVPSAGVVVLIVGLRPGRRAPAPRGGARRRRGVGVGGSGERGDARDVATDDEGLHGLGALVRVQGLDVGEVPRDAVAQEDAVAAEQVARARRDLARAARARVLRERRLRPGERAGLVEARHPRDEELHLREGREHARQSLLDHLVRGERPAELDALGRVRDRGLVARDRVPDGGPRHPEARREEHARGVLERPRARQGVLGGDEHVVEHDVRLPDRAERHLAGDGRARVARGVLRHDEPVDLAIAVVADEARPHDRDVARRPVADPLLLAVEHVALDTVARLLARRR